MKLHTEVGLGPFVTTVDVHLHNIPTKPQETLSSSHWVHMLLSTLTN